MKDLGPCPKCGSQERLEFPTMLNSGLLTGLTMFSAIPVRRRACAGCGFVEEWVADERHLAKLRDLVRKRRHRPS